MSKPQVNEVLPASGSAVDAPAILSLDGKVDILTGEAARLARTEKLDRLLAVDLRGTVLASWKAVEVMDAHPPASGGVILNMSWDHVLGGGIKSDYAQVFCAAKGGVYSFSRALAHSVAPRIRVNWVGPRWIETAHGRGR